jgi:endonuclease YncB( thermonuclease family)
VHVNGVRLYHWHTRFHGNTALWLGTLLALLVLNYFGHSAAFDISPANAAGEKSSTIPATITGKARVVDGDSLVINQTRLRLHGIDAPESNQQCIRDNKAWPCGKEATSALAEIVKGAHLNCAVLDRDRYRRLVVRCAVGEADLGERLVRLGLAMAYTQYSEDYVEAEAFARKRRVGIWSGEFVEPWLWRRGQRISSEQKPISGSCLIKRNISSSGEKIYHPPQGTYYSRTKVDPSKGERMFCSEEEAVAAGWRRSKR